MCSCGTRRLKVTRLTLTCPSESPGRSSCGFSDQDKLRSFIPNTSADSHLSHDWHISDRTYSQLHFLFPLRPTLTLTKHCVCSTRLSHGASERFPRASPGHNYKQHGLISELRNSVYFSLSLGINSLRLKRNNICVSSHIKNLAEKSLHKHAAALWRKSWVISKSCVSFCSFRLRV